MGQLDSNVQSPAEGVRVVVERLPVRAVAVEVQPRRRVQDFVTVRLSLFVKHSSSTAQSGAAAAGDDTYSMAAALLPRELQLLLDRYVEG